MSKKMFDYCCGNPPYQDDRQGTSTTALPVYHYFINEAYKVSDVVELIHPARFLFNAGRTPKEWNEKMLNDEHLKVLDYQQDASKVFQNTEIKGGVAITIHDDSKNYGAIKIFTIYPELNEIIKKTQAEEVEFRPFSTMAFVASKFNIDNLVRDYPQYEGHERRMSSNVLSFDCFHKNQEDGDIAVYGVEKGKRITMYIHPEYVDTSDEHIQSYKIITPKADGNGNFGDILTKPEILCENYAFTHTFLGLGGFEREEDANAALRYIKTKFVRALLSVLKITQDLNADKWNYVPLQDFTPDSDIDWSVSIADIDQQLYRKYGLSAEEIAFIETNVKEMT